jgi:hypothetical protein
MQLMARQHLPDAPEPTIRTNSNTQAAIDKYPAGVAISVACATRASDSGRP